MFYILSVSSMHTGTEQVFLIETKKGFNVYCIRLPSVSILCTNTPSPRFQVRARSSTSAFLHCRKARLCSKTGHKAYVHLG